MSTYPDADEKKSALTVAKRHIGYLSETKVGLFFFGLSTQAVKENIIKNLEAISAKKKEMKQLD